MFAETTVGKFFAKVGIKPITDLVAGPNGIVSLLKENSKPDSKISSRKSAASVMILTALAMVPDLDYTSIGEVTVVCCLSACGSILLGLTTFTRRHH